MSLVLDEHRQYLSDPVRLSAFSRALAEVVRPGAVVVDIGAGTGILGLLACRAGALRVYAIEQTPLAEVARRVAAANGFADRIHVIQKHSSEVSLPERADVIVGDFVGRFGFNAGLFDVFPPAARMFLKPGGMLVPAEISMFVAPVEHAAMDAQARFWDSHPAGLDLRPVTEWALNSGYPVAFDPQHLLGDGVEIARTTTAAVPSGALSAGVDLPIGRRGTLHGLAGWFVAQLSPTVAMTNAPGARERIARRNVFFPLREPIAVGPEDRVHAAMRILPREMLVKWTVDVRSSRGELRARSVHSTFSGWLVSVDDLLRTQPDFKPVSTPRGAARLTVLQLFDGTKTLREIEQIVFDRHREIFHSRVEAAAFVAEVSYGYAEL